jgi:D-amino-acid dehydrogenase
MLAGLRVGLRPMGPDIRPLLGKVASIDGLLLGNGLGAGGLTMGPYAGLLLSQLVLVSQLVLGGPTDIALAHYDPLHG